MNNTEIKNILILNFLFLVAFSGENVLHVMPQGSQIEIWDAWRDTRMLDCHLLSGVPLAYNTMLLNKISVTAE
jgi:hypothetical protein